MTPYTNNNIYTVQIARTIDDVEKLRSDWNRLNWHPNADVDLYKIIVSSRDQILRPHVITLYEDDKPKIMVVGRIENLRVEIKFGYKIVFAPTVRCLTIVYGGTLGSGANIQWKYVFDEIIKSLKRGESEIALLSHLIPDSELYRVATTSSSFYCRNHSSLPNTHWRISLPESMDVFFRNLGSRTRKNFRRYLRGLEEAYKGNFTIKCFRTSDGVEEFMMNAEAIAQKTYQRGMGEGFVNDMETRRLLVLAAERGWLRSYILFINNRPVAFDTALQYKNCFYLQNGGYDPAFSEIEPGINLFLGYLAELIDDGNIQCVDFGFGDAQYKRHICNESWNEESVYLFAPTLKAILLNLILTLNARLTKHISMLLRKSALYEKVKKFWRNRLTTKPRSQN